MNLLGVILKLRSGGSIAVFVLIAQVVLKKKDKTTTKEQTNKTSNKQKIPTSLPLLPKIQTEKIFTCRPTQTSLLVQSSAYALP